MRTTISSDELLPEGLYLESLSIGTERVGIRVASEASRSRSPLCGLYSSRVHSRYLRTVSDLPWHGISVELKVHARRFFCVEASCGRKFFCERLEEVGKVRVLGVDDFAFKKGTTYGTIIVNLEDHKVLDLLPEHSQESLVAWF
jgi:transposase